MLGGKNISNFHFADNTILTATNEGDLQNILIDGECEKVGLSIKKTVTMIITNQKDIPVCNIKLKGSSLKQVNSLKYLSALETTDGRSVKEMKSRIVQTKPTFTDLTKDSDKHTPLYEDDDQRECWSVASFPFWNMEIKLGPWTKKLLT